MIQLTETSGGCAPPQERVHEHLRQLLKAAWKDYQKSFRRCRAQFSEDSVHRLRVESRRLLALLSLLETLVGPPRISAPCGQIKKVLRQLARLRDTQVLLLHVEDKVKSFPAAKPFRNALRRRERRLIRKVGGAMHHARLGEIKSAMVSLRKTVRRLLADQPHERQHWDTLLRAVNRALARVTELRARCRADDLGTIHRTRIAFKKFRYMMELLQPLLPGVTRRELKILQKVQSHLGEIQDADVLVAALDKFRRKRPKEAAAMVAFQGDAERARARRVRQFLAGAGRSLEFQPFQAARSPAAGGAQNDSGRSRPADTPLRDRVRSTRSLHPSPKPSA